MKKIIYLSVFSIVLLLGIGFLLRDYLVLIFISFFLRPGVDFDDGLVPESPEYSNASYWAALPDRNDFADVKLVSELETEDRQGELPVDVFFIHPTTYIGKENWNQKLSDVDANRLTDEWVMRDQASVFNQCCRVLHRGTGKRLSLVFKIELGVEKKR